MPLKILLIVLVLVVVVILATSFTTFYSAIRPNKFVSDTTPADFNLKYESLTLTTEDGIKLDTWFIPAASKTDKTIIVLHGYPFDKGNILSIATFLHDDFTYNSFGKFGNSL